MANRDVSAAWQYHNATKHSLQSLRASPHFLDWANQPLPYKIYASVEPLPLPADFPPSSLSARTTAAARVTQAAQGDCHMALANGP